MTWQAYAACRDHDPELFFPTGQAGSPLYERDVRAALAVCATCPVQSACLRYALDAGEEFGVWGSTTEDDRRALRRVQVPGEEVSASGT